MAFSSRFSVPGNGNEIISVSFVIISRPVKPISDVPPIAPGAAKVPTTPTNNVTICNCSKTPSIPRSSVVSFRGQNAHHWRKSTFAYSCVSKSVRISYSFFLFFFSAAIDCAKTKSEKLTASRVLAAFFPILSYLDHVRSNNHARLFSYPRSYFYTYVNIHICRYRIYVATPVPQRVKSTFYFDVAKRLRHSLEAISSNRPIILFLPVRTCFDIPPELLILFHVPARIRPHENLRCSRNFCVTEKSKKRTYVTRHTENKNRNLYSFSSTRRRFFEVSKWKYIIGTYWNNKCECVTLAGIIFHIVNIISSRGNKWSERARDLGALFI